MVLSISAALVVGTALVVSENVSGHLAVTAVNESVRATEAVVRGNLDSLVTGNDLSDPWSTGAAAVNGELGRLVATGNILRIKVWSRDGTVVFSDLPALRGRAFPVADDLLDVFDGSVRTEFSSADEVENVFEHGLADRFLSIYLPIRAPDGTVVGAYEVYEDAAPIEASIEETRRDVLGIVGAMALGLLVLIFGAFSASSRRLTSQNRKLLEQAATEQILIENLRRSQQRYRSLVQNSADVNMIVGPDGTVQYESSAVERVLGYPAEDRQGRSAFELIHPDDLGRARQLLADVLHAPGAQASGELRIRHADGSWLTIDVTGKNLLDDPAVGGLVINYRDVTMRKELEDELRHQAFHDSLTGLANRALFTDRLSHAMSRTRHDRQPLAVLLVDLDDFKNINDSLGHGEGDELLVAVGERLHGTLRAGDTIARMGGDEFAVLLEDPPDSGAPVAVAERLLSTLAAPFDRSGKELFVHASIGVAVWTTTRQSADDLLRNADVSMYTAKSKGKNRIEVFEASMHAAAVARLALRGDLELALKRDEFSLLAPCRHPSDRRVARRNVGHVDEAVAHRIESTWRGGGVLGQHLELEAAARCLLDLVAEALQHDAGQVVRRRYPGRHGERGLRDGRLGGEQTGTAEHSNCKSELGFHDFPLQDIVRRTGILAETPVAYSGRSSSGFSRCARSAQRCTLQDSPDTSTQLIAPFGISNSRGADSPSAVAWR